MIHTARQNAKFIRLVRAVRVAVGNTPVAHETIAVGMLERMWHFTIVSAPRGDIGRHTDEMIAEACGWHGDPAEMIQILVESGWLDNDQNHRLVVHDWKEHAPRHIKQNIERKGGFVDAKRPPNVSSETLSGHLTSQNSHKAATPNVTKPNVTQPNQTKHGAGEPHDMDLPHEGDDTPPEPYSDDFLAFWDVFPQGRRKSKGAAWKSWQKSIKRTKPKVIIEAAREYATSDEGRGQFVKMPSTWLNNECWLDDRVAWGNSPSQRTLAYTPEGMAKANDQDL